LSRAFSTTAVPTTAVHQFLPVFSGGDAIGNHVLRVRDTLRSAGYDSEIFAVNIHRPVAKHARSFLDFKAPAGRSPKVHLLYHLSTGSRMAAWLTEQPLPVAVDYHNITPAQYFDRWEPVAAQVARVARAEMRRLASSTAFGLADSGYNAEELLDEGYPDTAVVPILVDFAEYDAAPDTATLTRLRRRAEGGGAHWLFVGRVAPHKCQHDILAAFAAYRRLFDPRARLSIVGDRMLLLYARALERLADELGVADAVEFTDSVKFPQLLAYYRAADLFVSLSEHEGFCVPLVEAMHFGVPTIAFASAAVPETGGDATLLLPDKDPLSVAVAAQRVLSDDALRKAMIVAGHQRVEHFSLENNRRRLLDALESRIRAHG
jgi:glycosyltransferase involved in cell wall biosynthesis